MRRRGLLRNRAWPDHEALRATVSVTVPFQDADPTGVAWHGNYFRYYDQARVALLEKLQFGYRVMARQGTIWPIIDTRVRYIRSAPFDQTLTVTAQLVEWELRLLIYYEIFDPSGARINEAYTVQVAVERNGDAERLQLGVPETLRARVATLLGGSAADGA